MSNLASKTASSFRTLHDQGVFVIANPWDTGSARILAKIGFKALATTSAGMAFSMGVREGATDRGTALEHCSLIVNATPLPVNADLENGFGDSPDAVAGCIVAAANTGLAGGSIEDHTGDRKKPIYEFDLAVERIEAACEASAGLDNDFVMTARCENYLWGKRDLADTIKRLQAFSEAGADVLYAPGLYDLETIKALCSNVDKPVNVVQGLPGATYTIEQLAEAGATRISVGSTLARYAYGVLVESATEMMQEGSFTFAENAMGFTELEDYF